MTHDEMIAVIQAHRNGKTIQTRLNSDCQWTDAWNPMWNFFSNDYRIKPEPREFNITEYSDGSLILCDTQGHALPTRTGQIVKIFRVREITDE